MYDNPIERLAIEQAIYNAIGADLKTGVAHNLRGEVNAHYLDLYEQTGATGFEVRVNGEKVGTYGFNKVKGTPARTTSEIRVNDEQAVRADDRDTFSDWLDAWLNAHIAELAVQYATETGELLDGMEVVTVDEPATPDGIRPSGTLRIKPTFVAQARAALEGGPIAGLLGGGA